MSSRALGESHSASIARSVGATLIVRQRSAIWHERARRRPDLPSPRGVWTLRPVHLRPLSRVVTANRRRGSAVTSGRVEARCRGLDRRSHRVSNAFYPIVAGRLDFARRNAAMCRCLRNVAQSSPRLSSVWQPSQSTDGKRPFLWIVRRNNVIVASLDSDRETFTLLLRTSWSGRRGRMLVCGAFRTNRASV